MNYLFGAPDANAPEMASGKGPYLFDSQGRRYIDAGAGTFNISLGYQDNRILDVAVEQMKRLVHCSSSYNSRPVLELAEELVRTSPSNLKVAHTKVCSGSTAMEGAVKLAKYHTGKEEVICFHRAHHGQTLITTSMSGFAFRRESLKLSNHGICHVPYPYYLRAKEKDTHAHDAAILEQIRHTICYATNNNVAAIVIEPILGNGGNMTPTQNFFLGLRELCDDHGIVLIFDEIQTGVGRTGSMYAADHFGVSPDILVAAKGLGGVGFQVAAILMEERFTAMPAFLHSFTYGSNPVACAAALQTLKIISEPEFLAGVQNNGRYLRDKLNELRQRHPVMAEVRGTGLMMGVEIIGPSDCPEANCALTNAIARNAMKNGLIVRTSEYGRGNVVKFRPCLTITEGEIDEICDLFEAALLSTLAALPSNAENLEYAT